MARHDAERVAELKRRVNSGVYRLDEAGIAEAFIRRMSVPDDEEIPDFEPPA